MNNGCLLTGLQEATSVSEESGYLVQMGDGTGSKHIKHKNLAAQLKKEIVGEGGTLNVEEMTYEETMDFLNGTDSEEEVLS